MRSLLLHRGSFLLQQRLGQFGPHAPSSPGQAQGSPHVPDRSGGVLFGMQERSLPAISAPLELGQHSFCKHMPVRCCFYIVCAQTLPARPGHRSFSFDHGRSQYPGHKVGRRPGSKCLRPGTLVELPSECRRLRLLVKRDPQKPAGSIFGTHFLAPDGI